MKNFEWELVPYAVKNGLNVDPDKKLTILSLTESKRKGERDFLEPKLR